MPRAIWASYHEGGKGSPTRTFSSWKKIALSFSSQSVKSRGLAICGGIEINPETGQKVPWIIHFEFHKKMWIWPRSA